jgi:membrane associated rhomboid family serine protease
MSTQRNTAIFTAVPVATLALIVLNSAIFALSVGAWDEFLYSGAVTRSGGFAPDAIRDREYWRFITYAFLHGSIMHLTMNMLCLLMWAPIVERRIGVPKFLVIYLVSAVAGGLVSYFGHPGGVVSIGASGAISGVVGALLALTLLRMLALPVQFFIVTIGLNAALLTVVNNVDWQAHLGGLLAGLAVTLAVARYRS